MALTSGFYDSEGHDRKYNAMQFGTMFDGVISDGVFEHYEKAFIVKDTGGLNQNAVIIQPGRAWFNHTWTYNDADLLFTMPEQSLALDRIDALVLRVDHLARENTFEVVMGVESSTPEKPTIVNHGPDIFDYPIAYIYRTADVSEIHARDIENTVGTSECPFSAGLIDGITTDELVAQWSAQWVDWTNEKRAEFIEWFNNIQYVLDGDVAGHLQNEIDDLETEMSYVLRKESAGEGDSATQTWARHETFWSTGDEQTYRALESIAPGDTLTMNRNIIPINSLGRDVGDLRAEVDVASGAQIANGTRIYMDYHDGKYGINTSSTRGADTFIPFKLAPINLGVGTSFDVSSYRNYQQFTEDNFIVYPVSISGYASAWNNYGDEGSADVHLGTTVTKSYNKNTGILTVSGLSQDRSNTTRNGAATLHTAHGSYSLTVGVMLIT